MNELDKAHDNLNRLVKAKLKINPGLESVERRSEYGAMIDYFFIAFRKQINEFVKSDVWKEIENKLHPVGEKISKAEPFSDDDFKGIQIIVDDYIPELAVQKPKKNDDNISDMFADFLLLVFNLGGQDFLNKHNIPSTFSLTNESIKEDVKKEAKSLFSGIDESTSKWIVDQIADGRERGLSNEQIIYNIKDSVPETYLNRAERIVRTETSRMVGESEHITAKKNGASHKEWMTVSDGGVCPICEDNESVGMIGIDQNFPSGDSREPAHPNCRCLVEYTFTPFMSSIWSGQ